ncbi:Hypothetical predicted protein [Xyrichtys novacula]|uniref:Uncharacterized protein n=1 Tax=Xyrichtys novacula TaxID=13765 RepID=A0AAV1G4P0_XYRNO|nr:Hypothetical predicted protein [Xyrichtys novacula]
MHLKLLWPLDGGREAEIGGRNSQKLRYYVTAPPKDSGLTRTLPMTYISFSTCSSHLGRELLSHVRLKT